MPSRNVMNLLISSSYGLNSTFLLPGYTIEHKYKLKNLKIIETFTLTIMLIKQFPFSFFSIDERNRLSYS